LATTHRPYSSSRQLSSMRRPALRRNSTGS
jgi:hypothetical protein